MQREHLLALAAVIVWGSFNPISKLALREMSPAWLALLRMGLGFVTLLALCLAVGGWPGLRTVRRGDLGRLLLIGVCGNFLNPFLGTAGLRELPASVGSLLSNTSPLAVAIVAPFLLKERPSRWAGLGLLAGLAGVALLLLPSADPSGGGSISPRGAALTLIGSLCWAAYTLLARGMLGRYHPFGVATAAAATGLPFLLLAALFEGNAVYELALLQRYWPHIVWLGAVSTGLGFGVWMIALRGLRAAALSAFQYLIPGFGIVFSYLILGERPTPIFASGAILVLVGVAAAQVRSR